MTADGQRRSGRSIGWKGVYFSVGSMPGMTVKRSLTLLQLGRPKGAGRCYSEFGTVETFGGGKIAPAGQPLRPGERR